MAKSESRTYADITKQIESLQKEAQALREKEIAEVIGRINEAIEIYGIKPEDLKFPRVSAAAGGAGRRKARGGAASAPRKSAKEGAKAAPVVKYSDGAGNSWSGRGPRPRWLRDALADGTKELSSFAV
ncbi:MAG: H-NS histone family protein [Acidovorax sp.]